MSKTPNFIRPMNREERLYLLLLLAWAMVESPAGRMVRLDRAYSPSSNAAAQSEARRRLSGGKQGYTMIRRPLSSQPPISNRGRALFKPSGRRRFQIDKIMFPDGRTVSPAKELRQDVDDDHGCGK